MEQIKAPFTDEQVKNLNEFQHCGFHEFTCGGAGHPIDTDNVLIATNNGWHCPNCEYTQDWAHDAMCDGSMAKAMKEFIGTKTHL